MVKVNWCLETQLTKASCWHHPAICRLKLSQGILPQHLNQYLTLLTYSLGWSWILAGLVFTPSPTGTPYSVGQELQLSLVRKMASPCPAVQYTP